MRGNDATPLGLGVVCWWRSQGSGVAATLGYGTESRWDSKRKAAFPDSQRRSLGVWAFEYVKWNFF